jgi:hypothetical protein
MGQIAQTNPQKEMIMRRTLLTIGVLVALFVGSLHAQTQRPYPELKKLEPLVGAWVDEGEAKATPLGPAGKFIQKFSIQWIHGGFFLEWHFSSKGPWGENAGTEVDGYDPINKIYPGRWWTNDGTMTSGAYTPNGRVITFLGTVTTAKEKHELRQTYSFAPDLMSYTFKSEISLDGKTWISETESKGTKVKPAQK